MGCRGTRRKSHTPILRWQVTGMACKNGGHKCYQCCSSVKAAVSDPAFAVGGCISVLCKVSAVYIPITRHRVIQGLGFDQKGTWICGEEKLGVHRPMLYTTTALEYMKHTMSSVRNPLILILWGLNVCMKKAQSACVHFTSDNTFLSHCFVELNFVFVIVKYSKLQRNDKVIHNDD